VSVVHHLVNQHLQPASTAKPGVNLNLSARPPKPFCPVSTELSLHDLWQLGLAHLMIR